MASRTSSKRVSDAAARSTAVAARPAWPGPTAREAWLTAAVLFAIALIVRVAAAIAVVFPIPEDTAYYVGVARNAVDGHGLVTNSLWSFQTSPLVVPRAAFEIWQPMPTFLAAIPMAIVGTAHWFRAAQVSSILVSATIPVLGWRLAADAVVEHGLPASRGRVLAVGVGLVCVVLGPLALYGALPDSSAPFAALTLVACLLMTRIAARPRGLRDRRLAALGVTFGLAFLTRSEALWLGLAWVAVAWFWVPGSAASPRTRRDRSLSIVAPAAIAAAIYAPWAVRNWQAFGTPLPGQTASNALYTSHMDIYAYSDPPTLARYLAQGPLAIAQEHAAGFSHDLVSVLIVQGFPIGLLGLVALPLVWRLRSLRPLVAASLLTFFLTSLVFPVSTQSGTFLHSAGAIYVLLVVACLFGLDAFIAWVGRIRHWYRPVAWLGPALALSVAVPIGGLSVATVARNASDTETHYRDLATALAQAGYPLDREQPVIANFPVWLSESAGVTAIALPDESPASVLSLARQFHAALVVVELPDEGRHWPGVLDDGSAAAQCFSAVKFADNSHGAASIPASLTRFHVFRIVCP